MRVAGKCWRGGAPRGGDVVDLKRALEDITDELLVAALAMREVNLHWLRRGPRDGDEPLDGLSELSQSMERQSQAQSADLSA